MYTSVLKFKRNENRDLFRRLLADRNQSHKCVMFHVDGNREEEKVMFCQRNTRDEITFFLRTLNKPFDVSAIREQKVPETGEIVRFGIDLANLKRDENKVYRKKADERMNYAVAKLTEAGLFVIDIKESECDAHMTRNRIKHDIPLYTYVGTAKVGSSTALKYALENGIGRYKSFGAGMLMIL